MTRVARVTVDEGQRRTARLVLDAELEAGRLDVGEVESLPVLRATRPFRRPSAPRRYGQRFAMKAGLIDGVQATIGRSLSIRRAAIGEAGDARPRFLLRLDEYPTSSARRQFDLSHAERLHDVLAEAGVPYLLSVVPRLARGYLDPKARGERSLEDGEVAFLSRVRHEGVALAQHGTTHRTRHTLARRHSELSGLGESELRELLASGREELAAAGIEVRAFVAPFNRFDFHHWSILAESYEVITGGPESIPMLGLQPSPVWHGEAVYLPSYSPLYAHSRRMSEAVDQIVRSQAGTWVPIVLHTGWEFDDELASLRRLARQLSGFACRWDDFFDAVHRSADTSHAFR